MFFELHPEKVIGYKRLSRADLGTGDSSHQTHIGLSEHALLFLADTGAVVEDSILVFNNQTFYLDTYFDKIAVPGGGFRSPKIRLGNTNNSVVGRIREIASRDPDNNWYLVYFGLSNGRIAFFLFDQASNEYDFLRTMGISFPEVGVRTINNTNIVFPNIEHYYLNKLELADIDELMNWEITSTDEVLTPSRRAHNYDIERANALRERVGKEGERLINQYLLEQKRNGNIMNVIWHNENRESYYPYDFTIEDNNAFITNIDVKSTSYSFNQKILFSSAEIKFISTTTEQYAVYRVYTRNSKKYLRISNDCKNTARKIFACTNIYKNKLQEIHADCESVKNTIKPNEAIFFEENEIELTF